MTGRDAMLAAFDRLFDVAAAKLQVTCTDAERDGARRQFADRFEQVLEVANGVDVPELPAAAMEHMSAAIERVSPAELAGVLASIPLARQAQDLAHTILRRQAEHRLIEHMAMQADTRYGGN